MKWRQCWGTESKTATLPIMHCAEQYLFFNLNGGNCEHYYLIVNVFKWRHTVVVSSLAARISRFLFFTSRLFYGLEKYVETQHCWFIVPQLDYLFFCVSLPLSCISSTIRLFQTWHYFTVTFFLCFSFVAELTVMAAPRSRPVSTDWFSLAGTKPSRHLDLWREMASSTLFCETSTYFKLCHKKRNHLPPNGRWLGKLWLTWNPLWHSENNLLCRRIQIKAWKFPHDAEIWRWVNKQDS